MTDDDQGEPMADHEYRILTAGGVLHAFTETTEGREAAMHMIETANAGSPWVKVDAMLPGEPTASQRTPMSLNPRLVIAVWAVGEAPSRRPARSVSTAGMQLPRSGPDRRTTG